MIWFWHNCQYIILRTITLHKFHQHAAQLMTSRLADQVPCCSCNLANNFWSLCPGLELEFIPQSLLFWLLIHSLLRLGHERSESRCEKESVENNQSFEPDWSKMTYLIHSLPLSMCRPYQAVPILDPTRFHTKAQSAKQIHHKTTSIIAQWLTLQQCAWSWPYLGCLLHTKIETLMSRRSRNGALTVRSGRSKLVIWKQTGLASGKIGLSVCMTREYG